MGVRTSPGCRLYTRRVSTPAAAPEPPTPAASMVRRFFSHGATYALAGALSQGIAFLLFPFFAHVFSPHEYGIIDLLGVLAVIVNLTVALEIAQGLGRHFVEAQSHDRATYASTALWFNVAVYTTFLVVAQTLAGPLTQLVLGSDAHVGVMRIALCGIWCTGMLQVVQGVLRWDLRPRAFATVSVVTAAVTTVASAVYVLALDWGVAGAIAGQLTGAATAAALAIWMGRAYYAPRFDPARLREMLAYSAPLVPASVGVFLNGYADRIAIQSQLSLSDVGLYGVGYRLSLIVSLTLIGFQGALVPLVLSRYRNPQTRLDLECIFRLFCAVALVVLLLISTFANDLLRLLTRPAYYDAATVVPIIVGGAFFAGMYVFAPGLQIARRTRPIAAISVVAGLVNVTLAFTLARPFGIAGVAVAFLVSSLGGFVALMTLSQRHYAVPHRWRLLVGAAVAIVAATALGASLPSVVEAPPVALAKLAIGVGGVALVAALLTRPDERDAARATLRSLVGRR